MNIEPFATLALSKSSVYLSVAEDFTATDTTTPAVLNYMTYVGGGISMIANDYGLGNYNYRMTQYDRDGIN